MPDYFLDSSALVKAYVVEPGSASVRLLLASQPLCDMYISAITPVEVVAALSRRSRRGLDPSGRALGIVRQFRQALELHVYSLVDVTPDVLDNAMDLAEARSLRGYDAVQLATALAVRQLQELGEDPLVVVSADTELNAAARREGLIVLNPDEDR